ncbi:UDP-glycosyltransferase UGT5-like [Culicoides brevitarsis]|uniref:UDP-glycosyltransferase UGT5-like n=1 Tax=Culicoides brevitarsis TaxID=469753 RepID=UPI00307C47EF
MIVIRLLLIFLAANLANGAKILAIFHTASKSHQILGQQLMFELNKAGHEITIITPFPIKNPPKGITNVYLEGIDTAFDKYLDDIFDRINEQEEYFKMVDEFYEFANHVTVDTLQHPNVQKLLKSDATFDLIFMEIFVNDAFVGFGHHYNCPIVAMSTIGMTPWAMDFGGAAAPMSFVPNFLLPYKDKMNLQERIMNILVTLYERYRLYTKYIPEQQGHYEIGFPGDNKPPLSELRKSIVSLVLLNSHFSISFPKALFPNMVEVGGMQINPNPVELPADIKNFIESAEHGVIYFSMGTNVIPSKMTQEKRNAILNSFAKLKQKVIWKWDDESLKVDPTKILVKKWMPQDSILAHPNVKLFITHGGLLSCTESIHHGVPILGVPIFGDQMKNVDNAKKEGWGTWIDYRNLTETSFTWALNEVLNNPKYTKTIKNSQKLFRDQPMTPLETAKFWVEYVLRHNGAPHMKSHVNKMSVIEYYNFDAYAILISAAILGIVLPIMLIKKILSIICRPTKKVKSS